MTFWLVFPLLALAQASCYDYEYYDPDSGSALPGNACAKQATGAAVGQPSTTQAQVFSQPSFPGQPGVAASVRLPVTSAYAPVTNTFATNAFAPATTFGASTPVFANAPQAVYGAAPQAVYGQAVYSAGPQAVYSTIAAPQVGFVAPRAAVTASVQPKVDPQLSSKLQYYKNLGERQARQHKQNSRIVSQASSDLSRQSLVNRLVAGTGNTAPWYPIVRLGTQKKVADAYKSEKQIANKNAEDAYQRYQQDPSRLNLLVSKYQDLNADLRDAAYHYNVINTGTFGQRVSTSLSIFGGSSSGGLLNSFTQIITQRKQSEDLEDIQRQMQRIARQIQTEAKTAVQQKSGGTVVAQGSVQQRLMATTVYGPQQQQARG
jgi:hypothetical protein